MTTYISSIQSTFPQVYEAKRKLNEEFLEKGRILDAIAFLYYPVQHGPMSHGELEIEGSCYYFRSCVGPWKIPEIHSYHKKIYKIRRSVEGKLPELAFVRFGITITPKQLNHIRTHIDDLRGMVGLTCMQAVQRALSRYTNYSIPFPISLFPTTTAAVLYVAKKIIGSSRITSIDPQIYHRPLGFRLCDVILGVAPEGMGIAASVTLVYNLFLLNSVMNQSQ